MTGGRLYQTLGEIQDRKEVMKIPSLFRGDVVDLHAPHWRGLRLPSTES
jgi:hypothetical protein